MRGALRNGGIYILSSGGSQALILLAWIILPWWMPAEAIGQFALISFGVELTSRLILLGTDSALLRLYVEKRRRVELFRAACSWLLIGALGATAVVWATRNVVPVLIPGLSAAYAGLMWLMVASAVATAVATFAFGHLIAIGDAPFYGKLAILRSALVATGSLAAGLLSWGVSGLVLAQILAAGTVTTCFLWRSGIATAPRRGTVASMAAPMREIAAYGFPMTIYALFSLSSDYAGRLVLDRQVSLGELGVFQFYYLIASQMNGVFASLNRAWSPYMFELLDGSRPRAMREMADSLALFSSLYALGLVAVMMCGTFGIIDLLVPAEFARRVDLFYVLLLAPLFCGVYTAMYPAYYFGKNTTRISVVQSLVSVVATVATVILTVTLTADGAALGWVLASFIAPVLYLIGFPGLARELRPVAVILVIWGACAALTIGSLLWLRSTGLAMAILLAGAGLVAVRRRTEIPAPKEPRTTLVASS